MIRKIKTGNLLSADFRALLYLYSAAYTLRRFYSIMRRTTPFEPVEPTEPTEPAEPLSYAIKGQHARGANPEL